MPELPWTNAVSPPPVAPFVLASQLRLRSLRHVPGFLTAALRVRRQMLRSQGCGGVSLIAQPFRRTFWTLSSWSDEPSMSAAITQQPHRDVMTHYRGRMAGSAFVTYKVLGDTRPAWDEAKRRLDSGT